MKQLIAIFTLSLCVTFAFAQSDSGKKYGTLIKNVQGNIYMLETPNGNLALQIGYQGIFAAGNLASDYLENALDDIAQVTEEPIRLMVNTQFDAQRTSANGLAAENGAIIMAQENAHARMQNTIRTRQKLFDQSAFPHVKFKDDLVLNYNGEKIMLYPIKSGYSDCDVVVHFEDSNVLMVGNLFENKKYPEINLDAGGSLEGYLSTLEAIRSKVNDQTKIISTHGKVSKKSDLNYTIGLLTFLWKRVNYHYVNKTPKENILNMTSLTEEYDAKNYGSDRVTNKDLLQVVYNEIERMAKKEK